MSNGNKNVEAQKSSQIKEQERSELQDEYILIRSPKLGVLKHKFRTG